MSSARMKIILGLEGQADAFGNNYHIEDIFWEILPNEAQKHDEIRSKILYNSFIINNL